MKTKRIIIALALLAGIVAAGLCGILIMYNGTFTK